MTQFQTLQMLWIKEKTTFCFRGCQCRWSKKTIGHLSTFSEEKNRWVVCRRTQTQATGKSNLTVAVTAGTHKATWGRLRFTEMEQNMGVYPLQLHKKSNTINMMRGWLDEMQTEFFVQLDQLTKQRPPYCRLQHLLCPLWENHPLYCGQQHLLCPLWGNHPPYCGLQHLWCPLWWGYAF